MKLKAKFGFELEVPYSSDIEVRNRQLEHFERSGSFAPVRAYRNVPNLDQNRRLIGPAPFTSEGDSHVLPYRWSAGFDAGGIEYRSPVFQTIGELETIRALCKEAYKHGLRPRVGAGTHIHMNVSDIGDTPYEIALFQRFLLAVEAGVFSFSSPARVLNGNCNIFRTPALNLINIRELRNSPNANSSISSASQRERWNLLTSNGILPRGHHWAGLNSHYTLEFRCFPSTLDADSLINWIKLLNLVLIKFKSVQHVLSTWDSIPYMWPNWHDNIDNLDVIADKFAEFIGAPEKLHQWVVAHAADVFTNRNEASVGNFKITPQARGYVATHAPEMRHIHITNSATLATIA